MDILKSISLAGVVSFILALFNKEHEKYNKNKEKYFDEFLVKFYAKYKAQKDINVEKFVEENYDCSMIYIPPYVHFLVENKEYEKVKKVLITDYLKLFPNFKNTVYKSITNIGNIVDFLYLLIIFAVLGFSVVTIIFFLGMAGLSGYNVSWKDVLLLFISAIVVIGILAALKKYFDKDDIYTFNKERIEELINSRVDSFNALLDTLYF